MPKFDLDKLPQKVLVKFERTPGGNLIAELPSLGGVFTQAENLEMLNFSINDLIMGFFDVPKKIQECIWYKKIDGKSEADTIKAPMHFQIFVPRHNIRQ